MILNTIHLSFTQLRYSLGRVYDCDLVDYEYIIECPREDAGGLSREYVLRIPSVS